MTLDGTGSKAFDGAPLDVRVDADRGPAGSNATLSNPAASQPTFVADLAGTYDAQLVVINAGRASAPDKVTPWRSTDHHVHTTPRCRRAWR